ncbi:MAG: SDR family oxidoreductase [Clostridia bacterium]|nr:SDR family oxidoreductase [Clostridia bacterium]
MKQQVVWITGASSGLGLHTAQALAKSGFTVVAGARSFGNGKSAEGCLCLPLDVTSPQSIDAFAEAAIKAFGAPDILVNCAGMLILGACESYPLDELRQVMETNFFGQAAMISKALPLMRERGHGKIVNFSSINGLLGIPFEGAYTASKHAIEGYSECLALETKDHGIQIMVVEPGDHQSGSQAYRRHSRGITADSPYKQAFDRGAAVIAHDEANGSDPDALGRKIANALQKKRLPRRLRVAKWDQHFAVILHDLLPTRIFDRIIGSYYRKPL